MEEQANEFMDEPAPEAALKPRNPGWFQRGGDGRINRQGRPKGSGRAAKRAGIAPEDRAACADRLMRLIIPRRDLTWWMTHREGAWVVNLPPDFELLGCRVDAARDAVVFVVKSATFPRIARGSLIPELVPLY